MLVGRVALLASLAVASGRTRRILTLAQAGVFARRWARRCDVSVRVRRLQSGGWSVSVPVAQWAGFEHGAMIVSGRWGAESGAGRAAGAASHWAWLLLPVLAVPGRRAPVPTSRQFCALAQSHILSHSSCYTEKPPHTNQK